MSAKATASNGRALANQVLLVSKARYERLIGVFCFILASILSIVVIALFTIDYLFRNQHFEIDEVKVIGKFKHSEPSEIVNVIRRQALKNWFSINLDDIKQAVEGVIWVESADVRREWPNRLTVTVLEHQPVMKWGSKNTELWVNSHGDVIQLDERANAVFETLLKGSEKDAKLLLKTLYQWQPKLKNAALELIELELSPSHSWRLALKNNQDGDFFEVFLGSTEVESRLERFLLLYQEQLKHTDKYIVRVDARYPNGLAVKTGKNKKKSDKELDKLVQNTSLQNITTHNLKQLDLGN